MKHLIQYIKEGLFDVGKNVSDTHELERNIFVDINSDFWKYCKPVSGVGRLLASPEELESCIDINKNIIRLDGVDISLDTAIKKRAIFKLSN